MALDANSSWPLLPTDPNVQRHTDSMNHRALPWGNSQRLTGNCLSSVCFSALLCPHLWPMKPIYIILKHKDRAKKYRQILTLILDMLWRYALLQTNHFQWCFWATEYDVTINWLIKFMHLPVVFPHYRRKSQKSRKATTCATTDSSQCLVLVCHHKLFLYNACNKYTSMSIDISLPTNRAVCNNANSSVWHHSSLCFLLWHLTTAL